MGYTSVNKAEELTLGFFLIVQDTVRDIDKLNGDLLLVVDKILGPFNLKVFHKS